MEYIENGYDIQQIARAMCSDINMIALKVDITSLNALFLFLGAAHLKLKSLKLQQQVYCPEEKELTKAEYARLIRTAKQKGNERLNLVIQTICGTGIRVSELQFITVEAVEKGEAVVSLKGKTRTVFIVKDL